MNFRTMEEFWPFYMNQHSKPATRRWHFAGTLASILCFIYSLCFNWWFVFFVPLFGYGLAWYSHFFVEKNFPATLSHPFWSLLCDFKMFGLMLTGQLDREIKRLGKRPMLQVFWSFHDIFYFVQYTFVIAHECFFFFLFLFFFPLSIRTPIVEYCCFHFYYILLNICAVDLEMSFATNWHELSSILQTFPTNWCVVL